MQKNISKNIFVRKYGTMPESGIFAYYDGSDLSDKKQENYQNYKYSFEKLRKTQPNLAHFTGKRVFKKLF